MQCMIIISTIRVNAVQLYNSRTHIVLNAGLNLNRQVKTAAYDNTDISDNENIDDDNDNDNACPHGYSNTLTYSPGSVICHWVQP